MDGQTHGRTNRQTDGQTDGWTDRWTYPQLDASRYRLEENKLDRQKLRALCHH